MTRAAMPDGVYHAISLGSLLLLVLLELRSRVFRQVSFFDRRRAVRNWLFLAAAFATMTAVKHVTEAAGAWIPPLVTWRGPFLIELVACFVVADGLGWLLHYVKHKNGFLWKFHFQHHREEAYTIWLTTHTHGLEVLISATISTILLTLLGFSVLATQIYLLFYAFANTYQHSGIDYGLGWLDKIIVGPAYHRHHHAVGSDTNYGDTLTIWDVVFRTVRWPKGRKNPGLPIGLGEGTPEPFGFWQEMTWFLRRAPRRPADAPAPVEVAS